MSSKIRLTFLGTADSIPDKNRNHTSIFLQYQNEGILIDCGEGTQRQFKKVHLNPGKISRILITHWHGDHVLGIPGILQTLSLNNYNKELKIYGPNKTKLFMNNLLKTFIFSQNFKIKVEEVNGKFLEENDFYIQSENMIHGIPCNAYSFILKGKIRINKEKLKSLNIPEGKYLKNLKEGKDIQFNGKKYKAKDLTYKEKEIKISFILDTEFNKKIIQFVKNSDLLICEATFKSEMENKAKEHKHLTSKQAGEIAKKSKSKKLILTHISQRYSKNLEEVLNETKKIFSNTILAKDFDNFEI